MLFCALGILCQIFSQVNSNNMEFFKKKISLNYDDFLCMNFKIPQDLCALFRNLIYIISTFFVGYFAGLRSSILFVFCQASKFTIINN